MTGLQRLRDAGPVARRLPSGRLPVPEVAFVLVGAGFALVPVIALLVGGGDPWPWTALWGAPWGWLRAAAWETPWGWSAVGAGLVLIGRLGRSSVSTDWLVPALTRATEYAAVIAVGGATAWTFGLLAALAYRHYDLVHLSRAGRTPPNWSRSASLGWELRVALLLGAGAIGAGAAAVVALTVWLAPVALLATTAAWGPASRQPQATR